MFVCFHFSMKLCFINITYICDYKSSSPLWLICDANWCLYRKTCTDCLLPFPSPMTGMYNNIEAQPGGPRPPANLQANPFGNAFYGAGSGLLRGYVEKSFGSGSEYVQSNASIIPRLWLNLLFILDLLYVELSDSNMKYEFMLEV